MAYKIPDFDGLTLPVDAVNLYGAIDDNATIVNSKSNNDIQVFFQRAMDKAGMTANSTPDNQTNGWQFFDAVFSIPFIATGITYPATSSNLGSPYYAVGYRISGNMVDLCGVIAVNNTVGGGTLPLFTLPTIVRPTHSVNINAVNTVTNTSGLLTLSTAGVLSVNASGSGTGNIYLDGIRFRLS